MWINLISGTSLDREARRRNTGNLPINYCEIDDDDPPEALESDYDGDDYDDDLLFSPQIQTKSKKKGKRQSQVHEEERDSESLVDDDDEDADDDEEDELDDEEDEHNDAEERECEEVDQTASKSQKKKKSTAPPIKEYQWFLEDISEETINEYSNDGEEAGEKRSPFDYFRYDFSDDILELIVEQTNLYSVQRHPDNVSMNLTLKELKVFMGLWIFMGICSLPCYHDYWSGPTRVPLVAEAMRHSRFKLIRARLHFADNTAEDNTGDALRWVRPLVSHIQNKCKALDQHTNQYSIDESVIRYKGKKAGNLRQYVKNKPHKWGYKAFVLTSSSGVAYDFFIYSGKDSFQTENVLQKETLGIGGNVVYHLCLSIQDPQNSAVCFDYFSSLALVSLLKSELGLLSAGTIRTDRVKGCPVSSDKALKKHGRGASEVHRNEENVVVVKWSDNRCVNMVGSWAGMEPQMGQS